MRQLLFKAILTLTSSPTVRAWCGEKLLAVIERKLYQVIFKRR